MKSVQHRADAINESHHSLASFLSHVLIASRDFDFRFQFTF